MKQLFTQEKSNLSKTLMTDKFIIPPFSVINTHQPYFRERLRMWRDLGFYVSDGRTINLSYDNRRMDKKKKEVKNGTSVFNPVVCEVLYKWFTVPNSKVLDPFAGGPVRGAMAVVFGHNYVGYDTSKEQIDFNKYYYKHTLQEKYILNDTPTWINESSENIKEVEQYDYVLTCPPYYNLEKYTDLPEDLSNKPTYLMFLESYKDILNKSVKALKEDCFYSIVVSDVRDKRTTEYIGLVADTIKILQDCGLLFYNELIIYNDTGNLAITSGDYLNKARKVGRQHQNVLVFYKGNPKNIKDKFGIFDKEQFDNIDKVE